MAQIHALTPEGRLPSQAQEHVREIVTDTTWEVDIPLTADWATDVGGEVRAYRTGNSVTVSAWRLGAVAGVTGAVAAYSLPPGYRPPPRYAAVTNDSRGNRVYLDVNTVTVTNPSGPVAHHSFTFVTLDPPPTQ